MKFSPKLEACRLRGGHHDSNPGDPYGAFLIDGPCGEKLVMIAHNGRDTTHKDRKLRGWEHVSVSTRDRVPNWSEMCFVKDLFWAEDECVVQFHPPKSDYINIHPYVLHLWRSIRKQFPMPPVALI